MAPSPPAAAEIFAAWLARRDPADPRALDALLDAHPERAADLRRLAGAWGEIEPALRLVAGEVRAEDLAARVFGAQPAAGDAAAGGTAEFLRRLAAGTQARYRDEGEIGHGGMGSIRRVFDEELRRPLAMKVALRPARDDDPSHAARFVEEAQVTGQLDHPGIVPVHELGLDSAGRPWFTMKLVRGRNLLAAYELAFERRDGWNETRAVGALLRVCEAVAYAHGKGVIHRDLKPANVMVGDLGEVYVMDWGVARVVGRTDRHDLRIDAGATRSVRTARHDEREESADSPVVTMDGTVVGTPAYMPPEQARGDVERLDPRSDVYAIGAMLYHLLARRMPYVAPGTRVSSRTVLARVIDGPPQRVHELRADAPAELVAICEKAMEREQARRYANTLELAGELRAYLEGRVVRAHEAGAAAELRKWIGRNRALAASSAAAVVLALAGLGAVAWVQSARNRDLERADQEIRGLSDLKQLQELRAEADSLWPALPARVADLTRWLERADAIVAHRPRHEAALRRLEALASTSSDAGVVWLRDSMAALIAEIDTFARADPPRGVIPDVRARLEFARTIVERSVTGADAATRWRAAIVAVRADEAYGRIAISPRVGLLPLGADPSSGLQEFAHLASGPAAVRGADGALEYADDTGVVLVLLPGATFTMGAVVDPDSSAHDPWAKPAEGPPMSAVLDAFYVGKHEMTQAQWLRIARSNPSNYQVDTRVPPRVGPRNPVERISWDEARTMLGRLDLGLPTEAQWEYAARAGTTSSWWTGGTIATLAGAGNLADATSRREGPEHWPHEDSLDDGAVVHAAVGSYRANPFGLHDVVGNVAEWCSELFLIGDALSLPEPPNGARDGRGNSLMRCSRGGSFASKPQHARSAHRSAIAPSQRLHDTGVRPVAALD